MKTEIRELLDAVLESDRSVSIEIVSIGDKMTATINMGTIEIASVGDTVIGMGGKNLTGEQLYKKFLIVYQTHETWPAPLQWQYLSNNMRLVWDEFSAALAQP